MSRRHRCEDGQSLVEFAIAIPIFLVLLLGTIDVGHVVWASASLANAAREGARYAIVRGGSMTSQCPVGPPAPTALIPAATSSCPYPSPSKAGIISAVQSNAIAAGTNINVNVCYGAGCSGSIDAGGATNARGTPLTVTATSDVPVTVGSLINLATIHLSSTVTMVVSH
jgi:TadE-like protein